MYRTVPLTYLLLQALNPRDTPDTALKKRAESPQADGLSVVVFQVSRDVASGSLIPFTILTKSTVFTGCPISVSCIITVATRSRNASPSKVGQRSCSQVTRTCVIEHITGWRGYTARVTAVQRHTSRWCLKRSHALSGCSTRVERVGHSPFPTSQCLTKYTFTQEPDGLCSLRVYLQQYLSANSFS